MAGVMPSTALLLTHYGLVQGEFESWASIAYYLGISIDDSGQITFMGDKVFPTYSLEYSPYTARDGFTKEEAIKDWAKYHMHLPNGYRIYRYIT